eukprot:CAMPEP_0172505442 /NCGR_PEP_ID=MMETSP1066-20121228/186520_1 /TAXON_ID=671091 /ORGANISM="Coscinodiscus wailesii, Strain CCMP2513" /LENGTH=291 /DNA_ID=CAMNT_0013282049 /DNA_START=299 /DNA_END=1170 /DNA_ORIENTATION=-
MSHDQVIDRRRRDRSRNLLNTEQQHLPQRQRQQRRRRNEENDDTEPPSEDTTADADATPPPPPKQHQELTSLYEGYGTHYVDLWVGSPTPQRQTVIVDTGSQLTAFPCHGCQNCGDEYHTDGYFNYEDSETFRKLGCEDCLAGRCQKNGGGEEPYCRLGLSYQEGSSWNAFEAEDVMYAGGKHNTAVAVDTDDAEEEEGSGSGDDGDASTDPILLAGEYAFDMTFGCQTSLTGLFKTQLADGIMGMSMEKGAFWRQMHRSGVIEDSVFSLCFNRQPIVDKGGTLAGAMSLG